MRGMCHCQSQTENTNKDASARKATKPNERWLHDIATIVPPKKSGITVARPQWHLLVDQYSGAKVSSFHVKKNHIVEPMCKRMHRAKKSGRPVLHL